MPISFTLPSRGVTSFRWGVSPRWISPRTSTQISDASHWRNNPGRAVEINEGKKPKPYQATCTSHSTRLFISLIALVVMLLASIASAQAKPIKLSWSASSGIVAGYRLYYGQTSQSYPSSFPSAPSLITTTTYTTPDLSDGTYYFVVRAFGPNGNRSGDSNTVALTISIALAANFSGTPTKGTTPLTVKFTNSSTGSIASHAWNFGDGTTSTAQNPTKIYSKTGIYSVKLTVTGSGKSATVTKTNYISVSAPTTTEPVASFTAGPTSGGTPLLVTFHDTSTGSVTSRLWNFGDGTTSTNQTYVKTYNTPGSYTAKLTVSNAKGSSTTSKTISATAVAPTATFSATPRTGIAPLSTAFTNTSSGTITSYSWNFGDGSTSTASNPTHSYATAGTYTVSLTAKGPAGTNTKTQTSYITVSKATGASGLVAAYNFEESQGTTTVVDKSGKGNHGVISGAIRSSGKFGNSLSFDGSNDWVKINDASSLDLTTSVTVEAWVYPDELRSGWWYCVLAKDVQGGAAYYLAANSDLNNPEFGIKTEDWKWNALHGGPSLRQVTSWVHLAATYDGAIQRLYVNGTQVSSRAQSGRMMVSSSPLYIGRSGVWSEYFKGRIDDVRIYNRALSASEIKADMNKPVP